MTQYETAAAAAEIKSSPINESITHVAMHSWIHDWKIESTVQWTHQKIFRKISLDGRAPPHEYDFYRTESRRSPNEK